MPQLYELTRKLAALFGGAVEVAKVFGGPEGLEAGDHERDDDVFGAGVADDALQNEIERILDPRRNKDAQGQEGRAATGCGSTSPDENEFDEITHRRARPRQRRGAIASSSREVERHATRLRAYLDDLGLRWEPQRARTHGRALDRTRLLPLVTRNDPRILVARTPHAPHRSVPRHDRRLLGLDDRRATTSAARSGSRCWSPRRSSRCAGVEARFFGFTDSVIYDAGTARDCDVSGLARRRRQQRRGRRSITPRTSPWRRSKRAKVARDDQRWPADRVLGRCAARPRHDS